MSDEKQLQASLNFTLEQLLHIGKALQNKCGRLMQHTDSNIELDINCIKDVALKLVETLQNSKGNILALLAVMENDIKGLNGTGKFPLFQEVIEKIQESRTSSVIIENGNAVIKQPVDKGVMVNLDLIVDIEDIAERTLQSAGIQLQGKQKDEEKRVCESVPGTRMFNLSLRKGRSDTEDTDDNWEDTLRRSRVKKEIKLEEASTTFRSCSLDSPVGDTSANNTSTTNNNSNGNVSTLGGDIPDLRVVPNVTDKDVDEDIVKVAEHIQQDADDVAHDSLVEFKDLPEAEASQVQSEHVDGRLTIDEEDDSNSVWSNETILEEVNGMDGGDVSSDCGSLEMTQTQIIQVANPNEETGENQHEERIREAPTNIDDGNDQDREVSGSSSNTLILENDPMNTTDLPYVLVDTEVQGAESDAQMIQQKADMSDKHSNNKVTEEKSEDEHELSLDILTQRDTSMDHVNNLENGSLSDGTDICKGKLLTDKHDEKAVCEESTENKGAEKEPVEAVDKDKVKMQDDKTAAIDEKPSPQVKDISDSDPVTYDSEEALSETNIDKVNTRDTNNEKADVDLGQKGDVSSSDSDTTCIDSSGTAKSHVQHIPKVTVHHMTGKDQILSESAGKNDVPHSRLESKLSDCDSFEFDVLACSQNQSVEENQSEDVKQGKETVDSKDVGDVQLSGCDVLEVSASTNDGDEDSQLVDVVMEEILENSDNSGKGLDLETTISVKEEPADRPLEVEDDEEEVEEEGGVGKLGDELLELFREVEMKKDREEHGYPKEEPVVDDALTDYESDDADAIFKAMEEDSTDTTDWDSDASDDGVISILDDSDIELLIENKPKESWDNQSNDELKQNFMKALHLKDIKMDRCYVRVKRADLRKLSTTWRRTETEDSIERLCDLSTINNRNGTSDEQPKSRHRKKRKKGDRSSDLSEDLFDTSSSNYSSDVEVWTGRGSSPDVSIDVQKKLDVLLASVALKGMKESATDSDSERTDDDLKGGAKTKKKKETGDDKETKGSEHTKLTEEEKAKKKWRNDKLLREKLESEDSSDSSTSRKSSSSRGNKRRKRKKYEDEDPDYQVDFNGNSDDGLRKKRMSYKDDNLKKSEHSDDSSAEEITQLDDTTDDSDVEFVFKDECPSPDLTPSQKGHRRNIRALMSDADLERATLLAKEAEEERIVRLKSKQKLRQTLSQLCSGSFSATSDAGEAEQEEEVAISATQMEEGLVLDVDENANKPLVQVDPQLTKILKSHQKAGIQFMWDCCYESLQRIKAKDLGSGCILAHCMGLGKTLQVLALIHTLFAYKETGTKHALVVCPLSTVSNWRKEVRLRLKDVKKNFEVFTIGSTREICRQKPILKQWYCAKRSILIMGYERYECLTNLEKLNKTSGDFKTLVFDSLVDPGPDLIVCDEGHLLRSKKSVKVQALNKVRTKRRIVLTGTPLQNNLIEYYHMVQFVKPNLLGNLKEFKTNFVNPITNGQYEDSTKEDIKLMKKRTHVLHNYLKHTVQRFEDTELQTYLKKMHHYAVFVQLHPVQVEFYKTFLNIASEARKEENGKLSKQKGFLSDFAVFQYICTHPYLLQIMDNRRNTNEREQDVIITDDVRPECNVGKWWKDKMPPDAENVQYGTKMLVVKHILEECEEIGDKVLIFSQSLGELDLIEHFLKKCGTSKCPSWRKDVDYTRMDGTVKPESRAGICDRFNEKSNSKLRLLLISIRVGGLGLNLTAANRVITMTVSWNPSYDLQSVFRVYRFGQEKAVYVYRLIAVDTMEEKAYQRTVTKLAVAHRVIDKYQIKRHYRSVDLQAMYSCYPLHDKQRPMPSVPEDEVLAKLILKLPRIYKYHEQQALLANRPEDDLNEQEKIAAWEEFEKEKNMQKAAKEAAAMAATFAKEAAAASAEAMAALAATSVALTKPGVPVPITPLGPTFNTAYSLCPPTTSSTATAANEGPNNNSSGQETRNGAGQPEVANTTAEAKNKTPSISLKFTEALEELGNLNNNTRINRKTNNPTAGQSCQGDQSGGAQPRRPLRKPNKQQQLSRPRLSQQVDEAPIDLTMLGEPDVVRGPRKDPLATCSNGAENVAGAAEVAVPPRLDGQWIERQKANFSEHFKNKNQKENQQQQMGQVVRTYKRKGGVETASKAAQMDHAYSATQINVKRKNDHLTSEAVPQKKVCNSKLRMNPYALLQPASAHAIASASKAITPEETTINLSDDEVEVVAAVEPLKPRHSDIINSLCRSGITVTTLAPSDNRTTNAVASFDEVITLE